MHETNVHISLQVIRGAGHHVYADEAEAFNQCVAEICAKVEDNADRFD